MIDETLLRALAFIPIIAYCVAKLEINIEGKHGWAENLPTWRKKYRAMKLFWGKSPLTGYHTWLFASVLAFLHFPFFLAGEWSLVWELRMGSLYFLFWILEDYLWFVLNPNFGLKKFNKENIPWHPNWLGPLPMSYYRFFVAGVLLLILSYLL